MRPYPTTKQTLPSKANGARLAAATSAPSAVRQAFSRKKDSSRSSATAPFPPITRSFAEKIIAKSSGCKGVSHASSAFSSPKM